MYRFIIILAAVVVAIGPATSTSAPAEGPSDSRPSKALLKIEGMTCGDCGSSCSTGR